MKITLFAAFICLAAALPKVRQVENLDSPHRIPGEFLVVLHPNTGRSTNAQYANSVATKIAAISPKITIADSFDALITPILHVKTSDESVMSQLYQLDEVKVIDSNLYQKMIQQCTSQDTGRTLWGLSRVSSVDLPDYTDATYNQDQNDGSGVRVYVLDTSIRWTHNDFGGRAIFGARFAGSADPDGNGHGTHCAGTVGGTTYGVAKGATLVAVKVLSDLGFGSTTGIINGINWAVNNATNEGVNGVLSMSLGGGASTALDDAVNAADANGYPVVVAAGNSNANACNGSPARATGAITVGASDVNDARSSFSSFGTCLDIFAPGTSILSAWHTGDTATNTISGTSMACPHVAGLVARLFSEDPDRTPAQIKTLLRENASADKLSDVPDGTPNLLMYSGC